MMGLRTGSRPKRGYRVVDIDGSFADFVCIELTCGHAMLMWAPKDADHLHFKFTLCEMCARIEP